MSRPRHSSLRRTAAWLAPVAVLVAAPKCLLCVLAYAGIGAALGLGSRVELCGASNASAGTWTTSIAIIAASSGAIIAYRLVGKWRNRKALAADPMR